jgi:hypothetical protein
VQSFVDVDFEKQLLSSRLVSKTRKLQSRLHHLEAATENTCLESTENYSNTHVFGKKHCNTLPRQV